MNVRLATVTVVSLLVIITGCGKRKRSVSPEPVETTSARVAIDGAPGVYEDAVVIGTTGSYTGAAAGQATEGYRGAMAYFLEVNASGGVHGRKIELLPKDDAYAPEAGAENVKKLLKEDGVFCIFGGNGSSVIKATTQVLQENKASGAFGFGTTNGAPFTREAPGSDVWYHVHSSYRQEGAALVEGLVKANFKRIGIFYQDDAFGQAGLAGVQAAMEEKGLTLVAATTHPANQKVEVSTSTQVDTLKRANVDAVISFTLYQPAAAFVRDMRDAGLNVPIANSSIANDTWLRLLVAQEKKAREKNPSASYLDKPLLGIHSVPNWDDLTIPVVAEFRSLMDKRNPQVPNEIRDANYRTLPYQTISLLSFVNAKVFTEVLRRTGPVLTRRAFRDNIERMSGYDPGLGGTTLTFSASRHQGTDRVFFVGVRDHKWLSLSDPAAYLRPKAEPGVASPAALRAGR